MKAKPYFWLLGLIALVAIAQAVYILKFYRRAVFADQWDLVPVLERYLSGGDWFSMTLTQHGGHYHTLAYFIMLPLAQFTNWNLLAEIVVIQTLNMLSFWLLFKVYLKPTVGDKQPVAMLVAVVFAALYFSPAHGDNILWSWQIAVYLAIFGCSAMLYSFASGVVTNARFMFALLGGMVGSFSFSCGFAIWPAGMLILLFRNDLKFGKRTTFSIAWLLTGALVTAWFLLQADSGLSHKLKFSITDTSLFLLYYLGTPIAYFSRDFSLVLASTGLITFVYLSIKLWLGVWPRCQPWLISVLGLAAFSIISGLLISIGRLEFGIDQARSYRYIIFSQFFWFSLLLLFWLNARISRESSHSNRMSQKIPAWFVCLLLVLVLFNGQKIGRISAGFATAHNRLYQQLIDSEPGSHLGLLSGQDYPDRETLSRHLRVLEKHALNFYRYSPRGTGANEAKDRKY